MDKSIPEIQGGSDKYDDRSGKGEFLSLLSSSSSIKKKFSFP